MSEIPQDVITKNYIKGTKHTKKISKIGSLALLLTICLVLLLVLNLGPIALVMANRKIPIYCVQRDDNKVALTFDAAWGADKTTKIMDICDEFGIKVTFFLVGFWCDKYPHLVKEIADRGHAIGTHSETHPKMGSLSVQKISSELTSSVKKITDNTGGTVKLFRPPFGDYSNNLIETADSLGLFTIQWSVDSLDWKGLSALQIAERILKAKSGDIILCHNNSDHIVEALPVIIRGLLDKKLVPVRVDEMLFYNDYYIDHSGKQINNKTHVS